MRNSILTIIVGFSISASLALIACKKDSNSTPDYYLKFKLDGKEKQYSDTLEALFLEATTLVTRYSCSMLGADQISGTVYEGMTITITSEAKIAANVSYTDATVASLGIPGAVLGFKDETGVFERSDIAVSPAVRVIITQIDNNSVSGTFSGNVVNPIDLTTVHTISEGQFHLPR